LKERFEKPLDSFLRLLQEGKWDLNEVTMNSDKGKVEFNCVSAFISQEKSLLLQNFIEGVMDPLGYKAQEKNVIKELTKKVRGITLRIAFEGQHEKDF
jgi:hypothetical protein